MRISPIYPVVEALTGTVCALLVWKFGLALETIFYIIFLSALIVVTFIDLEHKIIPNVITLPGIIIGLAYNAIITDWGRMREMYSYLHYDFWGALTILDNVPIIGSILGVIIGGGILFLIGFLYEVIRKREGMGMGDVKLLAMIGAFLGWKSVVFVILISSIIGTIVGVSIILYKKGDLQYAIPYGPFLSFAAAFYCLVGGFKFIL